MRWYLLHAAAFFLCWMGVDIVYPIWPAPLKTRYKSWRFWATVLLFALAITLVG